MSYQVPLCPDCDLDLQVVSEGRAIVTQVVRSNGAVETVETTFNRSRAHLTCPSCGKTFAIELDADFRIRRGKEKRGRDIRDILIVFGLGLLFLGKVWRPGNLDFMKDCFLLMVAAGFILTAWGMARPRLRGLARRVPLLRRCLP